MIDLASLSPEDRATVLAAAGAELARGLLDELQTLEEVEVAGLLKVDPRTARRAVPSVEIVDGVRRYRRADVVRLLEART